MNTKENFTYVGIITIKNIFKLKRQNGEISVTDSKKFYWEKTDEKHITCVQAFKMFEMILYRLAFEILNIFLKIHNNFKGWMFFFKISKFNYLYF